MIAPLLDLPANVLHRLASELELEAMAPPYTPARVAARLGVQESVVALAAGVLARLDAMGASQRATAEFLKDAAQRAARRFSPVPVWSGEHLPGTHARSTREVYHELFSTAEHSVWLSTYVVHDGEDVLGPLATRMSEVAHLEVTLLVNVERKWGDRTDPAEVLAKFATKFWQNQWPGQRHPRVFYDPRALDPASPDAGVLHAKVTVADQSRVFMTSANLTPRAMDRNVEAGLLVADRDLARTTVARFQSLIDNGMVLPLPRH